MGSHASHAPSLPLAMSVDKVVQDEKVDAIEMSLKFSLTFRAAEIDSKFTVVGGKHPKSVIRNLCAKSGEDRVQSDLKIGKHHFAINKKDAARPRRIPTENRPATRNGEANRQAEPGFPDTSRGVQHRETSLGQNRGQQHFARRHLKSQKILQANRLKRLDAGSTIRSRSSRRFAGANWEKASEEIHHARHHTLAAGCRFRPPSGECGRLSLRFFLNSIDGLALQPSLLGDFRHSDSLAQKFLDGSEGGPVEARLATSEFCAVVIFLSVEDARPLGLLRGLCLGLSRCGHECNQSIPNRLLHGVLGCAVKHHAIDDRADDNTSPHELADRIGDIAVVSAEPVHPANNEGVARPEQIEQPPPLGSVGQPGARRRTRRGRPLPRRGESQPPRPAPAGERGSARRWELGRRGRFGRQAAFFLVRRGPVL